MHFDHVSLHVKDLEASCNFYGNVIGLKEIVPTPIALPHVRWFMFANGFTVHIIGGCGDDPKASWGDHFAIAAQDFDGTMQDLTAKGVRFGTFQGEQGQVTIRKDGLKQIFLRDPDNNWIEINDARY